MLSVNTIFATQMGERHGGFHSGLGADSVSDRLVRDMGTTDQSININLLTPAKFQRKLQRTWAPPDSPAAAVRIKASNGRASPRRCWHRRRDRHGIDHLKPLGLIGTSPV